MTGALPSLSIVVEWENAKTSELDRAREMLSAVLGQVKRMSNRFTAAPEMILVHDEGHHAADDVMNQLRDEFASFGGTLSVIVGHGEGYYDQKNLGAAQAKNDLVLFVDSDIIPEEGWLENLIAAQVEEDADVAGGLTHIACTSFYQRAFASFWFFPVKGEVKRRHVAEGFAANNVIFRTQVAKANPFPDTGHVRGRCLRLAEMLCASGYKIVLEPEARVSHPPPNGISHFVRRALCQGHDNRVGRKVGGTLIALRQLYWDMRRSTQRIRLYYKSLGMTGREALGAVFVAFAYYSVAAAGEIISIVNPKLIPNRAHV